MSERTFVVGTFPPVEGSKQILCYTTWYNPAWSGCVQFTVKAANGTEAKKKAKLLRREYDAKLELPI